MGKNKQLNLPSTPNYYQNPLQQGDISNISGIGNSLSSGNIPSWLQSTINPNNSQSALTYAQSILQPQFRDSLQQISNQAAANGQLNSSTFTNALARSQSDLNSNYQGIVSQQAINDSNQANQNKLSLLGTGINTLQGAIGAESQDTGAQNQFNLSNYENQVAATLSSQKQQNGGFLGALTGAAGGALGGSMLGPLGLVSGGLAGGLAGGLSPQSSNVGGNILSSGSSLYGSNQLNSSLGNIFKSGFSAPAAGSYASNDLGISLDPYQYSLFKH